MTRPLPYDSFNELTQRYLMLVGHRMAGKVLITGASGLLGREVVQEFSAAGWDVTGTAFSRAHPPIHKIDLTDETAVSDLLNNVQYDEFSIFQLGRIKANGSNPKDRKS